MIRIREIDAHGHELPSWVRVTEEGEGTLVRTSLTASAFFRRQAAMLVRDRMTELYPERQFLLIEGAA